MAGPLPDGPVDTRGVRDAVLGTPEAVASAGELEFDAPPPAADGVVLVAAGPDARVVDAARALIVDTSPVPVVAHTGHGLPAYVTDSWRVVFVTHAPTPETLDALRAAGRHQPRLCAIGSGELLETVAEHDGAVVRTPDVVGVPRAAFAPTLVVLLRLLDRLGALVGPLSGRGVDAQVRDAVERLRARRDVLVATGESAHLARGLAPAIPLVYGAGPIGAVAAARWKDQINDNAKAPCFAGHLPNAAHHDLNGWGQHGDITRQIFSLVTLRHDHEHDDDRRRFPALTELVGEVTQQRHEVVAGGEGALAQLLDLVLVGDLVSVDLADEHEIDPGPTGIDPERDDLLRR